MEKLSLDQRLRSMRSPNPQFFPAFGLYAMDFFDALSQMTHNPRFSQTYRTIIQSLYQQAQDEPVFFQLVALGMKLAPNDGASLLYQVMVEPFAAIQERREKE